MVSSYALWAGGARGYAGDDRSLVSILVITYSLAVHSRLTVYNEHGGVLSVIRRVRQILAGDAELDTPGCKTPISCCAVGVLSLPPGLSCMMTCRHSRHPSSTAARTNRAQRGVNIADGEE
jgi:hypothetical protein